MNAGERERHRGASRGGTALCSAVFACGCLHSAAQAELFTVESSSDVRIESNDNVNLQPHSPGTVNTLSLSTSIGASRQTENSATRLNAAATALQQWGRGGNDRVDGRVGVTQSYNDPLNTVTASAQYTQDFNNTAQNVDVTVDRGQRRSTLVSASWGRLLTERLSASTQVSTSQTSYGQQSVVNSASSDFRNTSVSAALSYAVTETDTVTVQTSHSEYHSANGGNRSSTNDLSVGVSRVLSERVTASLVLGVYQTDSSSPRSRLACPLAISLCEAGLVPFIVVSDRAKNSGTGLLYNSTYRYQFSETSSLSFATGSQQTPSGAGEVVRSNTLSLGLAHSFSETWSAAMNFAQSRSTYQGSTARGTAQQRTVSLSMSKQLAPDLSVQSSYQWTQSDNAGVDNTARSNSVGVALKYDWPKFEATR